MNQEKENKAKEQHRENRDAVRERAFKTAMHIMCNPNVSPKIRAEASALGHQIAIATLLDETLDRL